ncbi:MAG: polymerase subunit beta [Ignavibacteria bacterium]|nr:polymerase subunit beta [Ignavibacteria bacterium]
MTDENVVQIIRELSDELKALYPEFRGIYLFGSYARGDAREDSDLDVAVIINTDVDSKIKKEIGHIVYEYDLKYDILLDEHIYNYKDIFAPITPLRQNIKTEGIYYAPS